MDEPRKRSPRSPAMPLKEAMARALAIHEKEGRHTVPADVAAQDMGYKDAQSGRSRRALATLRQFGLIITPKDGYVAISRQLETYKYAPDEPTKRSMLLEFFRAPSIYKTLIAKFPDRLPSDAALKFEFIQLGFVPNGVDEEVRIFRQSGEYSGAYTSGGIASSEVSPDETADDDSDREDGDALDLPSEGPTSPASGHLRGDRIPIRLTGGRRAVLEIPAPFYEADKRIIKAQIDLVLTDDEAGGSP
jgi:hypothetical protein